MGEKWRSGKVEWWGTGFLNAEAQSGREAESFHVQTTVGDCGIV